LDGDVPLDARSAALYELLERAKGLNETECLEYPEHLLGKRQNANPARSTVFFWKQQGCTGGARSYSIGPYESSGDDCVAASRYSNGQAFRSVQQVAFCTPNKRTNGDFNMWSTTRNVQGGQGEFGFAACYGSRVNVPKNGCVNVESSSFRATDMVNAGQNC
jgi:hypothetical protein